MNIKSIYRLVATVLVIGYLCASYAIFSNLVFANSALMVSMLIGAITLGNLAYCPIYISNQRSNSSRIGLIGIVYFLAMAAFVSTLVATYFSVNERLNFAYFFDVMAIALLILQSLTISICARTFNSLESRTRFPSSHILWSTQLSNLANECNDLVARSALLQVADDAKFLARDLSPIELPINHEIDLVLSKFNDLVVDSHTSEIIDHIKLVKNLFAARELQIKRSRSDT